MPRPQKSMLDLEINGFLVVECLSDTESTTDNHQPRYIIRCLHCGKEKTRSKQGLHTLQRCRCQIPKPPKVKKTAPIPTLSPIAPDARVISRDLLLRKPDREGPDGPRKSPATADGTLLYLYPGHPSYGLGRKPKPVKKEQTL